MIRQRILVLWANYRLHHIAAVTAKAVTMVVVFGATAAPIVTPIIRTAPIIHKPIAVTSTARGSNAGAPVKPKPKPQPAPVATAPTTPAPTTAPVTAAPKPVKTAPTPKPMPVSAPSPGSGAKTLSPTTSTPPATTTSPTSPSDTSGSSSLPPATGGYTSTNWSGYVAMNGGYSAVNGSWKVPSVTGNGTATTGDSTWIGIGGVSSNDLIQTGTENMLSASGTVSTAAFYELLPDAAMEITSMTVSAGDTMTASISETTAGTWLIKISDLTTGQSFSNSFAYTSTHSSAEWIEEDPSYTDGTLVPFDNFGTAWFSGSNTTANGVTQTIATANGQPITLVNSSSQPVATPSVLNASGDGFSVTHN